MKVKQKVIGEKNIEHSQRYKMNQNNHDSTPSLLRAKQQDKENNQNQHNHINRDEPKFGQFDPVKSTELPKRLQTSVNQQEFAHFKKNKSKQYADELRCSQDFVVFRQKMTTEPQEEEFFKGQHITFGVSGQRNPMITSREFLEDKKVKNEVIDQIMGNAKRGLCKSFNQFNFGLGNCANHTTKKAKYRLIAELSEGEQQRFYCSKCAINLLQQNFKIEEIKCEQTENQNNSLRLQQITKFQLRLKSIEERAHFETDRNYSKEQLQAIQEQIQLANEKFTHAMEVLQGMKNEYISSLNQLYMKKENEEKGKKQDLVDMLSSMRDIQQQIKEYKSMKKFALMKENQFQFITSSLNNKINKFDEQLQKIKAASPCRRFNLDNITELQILDKLKEQLTFKDKQRERREREITFSRRSEPKERMSEDELACDEMKRPFRELFPTDETDQNQFIEGYCQKNKMLCSLRERPTFERPQ